MTERCRSLAACACAVLALLVGAGACTDDGVPAGEPPTAGPARSAPGEPVRDRGRAGFWFDAARVADESLEAARDGRVADLANLPYTRGSNSAPDDDRVTYLDLEGAQPGLTLVVSGHEPHAAVIDLKGNVLHEWSYPFEEAWPDTDDLERWRVENSFWRRVHVFPNGDLLAIYEDTGIVKLDRDSKLLWRRANRAHHDLWVAPDGRIYVLTRTHHLEPLPARVRKGTGGRRAPFLEDFVTVLSPDGDELSSVSVFDCVRNSPYGSLVHFAPAEDDIFHTNTLEIMTGAFADRHPLYAAGNALISISTIQTIAVLDLERQTTVWAMTGLWVFQHQPTVVEEGRILVFDNAGLGARSRVIEVDPVTQRIHWVFGDDPSVGFWSHILGSNQRLANGNTLITESVRGRAFEVTPGKEVVWEYLNPHRAGAQREWIATLFEAVRLPEGYFAGQFAALEAQLQDAEAVPLEGVDALLRGRDGK